jgi:hypothetical protein
MVNTIGASTMAALRKAKPPIGVAPDFDLRLYERSGATGSARALLSHSRTCHRGNAIILGAFLALSVSGTVQTLSLTAKMKASYSHLSGNKHLVPSFGSLRGTERMVPAMRTRWRKDNPSDWRLTMEQIGRELRKVYRRPERLPGDCGRLSCGSLAADRRPGSSSK